MSNPTPRRPPQPGFRIADAEQLLIRAFEALGGDVVTPTASQVKAGMFALDPSFDEANYGCAAFRAFLAHLPHRVRTAGRSGGDIILALIDQPTDSVTEPGP